MKITLHPIHEYAGISEENFWSWLYARIPHLAGKDEAFFLRLYGKPWLDEKWLKYKRDTFDAFCNRLYKERTPEAYDYCVISFNCRYNLVTSLYFFDSYKDEETEHTRLMFINTNRDPEFFENVQKFYETKRIPDPHIKNPLYTGNAINLEMYPSTETTTS